MSDINYKDGAVAGPSIYGIDGNSGGIGSLQKANLGVASASITLDDSLIGKWITIVAQGANMFIRCGKSGDALTAVTTDAPFADKEKCQFLVSKYTQQIAFIGSAAVTNGVTYWCSEYGARSRNFG